MKTATNFGDTARSFFAMLAIIALLAAPIAPVLANSATTTPDTPSQNIPNGHDDDTPKVTICHDNDDGGFNPISISINAVIHSGHTGHATDIIPPFGSGDDAFPGKNWDTKGRATWNNHCVVPPTPSTLKVHIYKYLKNASTTTQVPNDAGIQTFPMISSWSATNIGSSSGSYVLGDTHGGALFTYAADTSAMSVPADYTTSEVTGGDSSISVLAPGAACVDGKYRLVGYKAGDSLSAAQNATLTTTAPAYTGLTADKYVIVVNEKCVPVVPTTPKQCFVVSDTTNLLGTTTATAALVTPNPAWTTALATGTAKWIWSSATVLNPGQTETATFTKYFNVDVVPAGATLRIAADNSYTASLNGTPLSCDGSGILNYSSIDTCSAPVVAGINTLTFTATNAGVPGETNPAANPAGLTYELQIDGSSCSPVPPDACLNIVGLQTVVPGGYSADANHICTPVVVEAPFCRVGSNLLQNASFETPVVSPSSNGGKWQIFPIVANWAISNDGLEIWNKFMGSGAGLASAGNQNVELDGNSPSTISQVITTVPGATYELRYDFSPRAGTNLADNSVAAQAGGVTISSTSADGSTNTGNVWTTHSKTFVATSTNTTITFKDLGTPDSLGTLIDNTGVCFVSPAPAPTCNLVEVSGTSTQVTETASTAKILSYVHPAWTAVINGALWIWGHDPVNLADTQVNTTQHFTKTFVWHGAVGAAALSLAADNSYIVKLNGTQIGADAGEFNYNSAGQDIITGFNGQIQEGTNILEIAVTNKGIVGSTQKSNPAGLLYKLTVTGSDRSCDNVPPPVKTSEVTMCKFDQNENALSGWTLTLDKGGILEDIVKKSVDVHPSYSGVTERNGCITFHDVPYGTYTKGEVQKDGWTNISGLGAGVVGSSTAHFNIFNKTTKGTLQITKYVCPANTSILRSNNGVGGTVPENCQLATGATFGYVHGLQTDANGPYPELSAPLTAAGTTTNGDLTVNNLPADGRYLVVETDSSNHQLPGNAILGLFCTGDGDTSNNNDNQELTFITPGHTTHCVAYNKLQQQGGGGGEGGGTHPPLYHIFGNSWNDANKNDGKDEGESNLGGWTVSITDGGTIHSTTTDENGNYYFDVPAGAWTITEGAHDGWELNFPHTGSYVVTVPAVITKAAPSSFLAYFVSVAEAAVITPVYGPYNFGSHIVPTTTTTTGGGGGGGGGTTGHSGSHNSLATSGGSNGGSNGGSTGEVLGASTSNLPNGEVLGAVVPVGAPNTGEGGADTDTTTNALTVLFVALLGLALLVAPKRA